MAGLLLAQGHGTQAREVYTQLLAQRPHDGELRSRVAAALAGAHAGGAVPPLAASGTVTEADDSGTAPFDTSVGDAEFDDAGPSDPRAAEAQAEPSPVLDPAQDVAPAGAVARDDERAARMWRAAFAAPSAPQVFDDPAEDLARFNAWLRGPAECT
jgi:hypothetical protein